ncbi:hypothetical protein N9958_00240 [bacterium]|nr:hypothetical protein [bacterium]
MKSEVEAGGTAKLLRKSVSYHSETQTPNFLKKIPYLTTGPSEKMEGQEVERASALRKDDYLSSIMLLGGIFMLK